MIWKLRRQHVAIAERPVGDAAEHAEALVHGGLDFAPERAVARPVVEILDHRDRRQVTRLDIVVPLLARRDRPARRLLGADQAGARQADDRREFAVDRDHRFDGEADGAALGRHQFEAVAYRRRVPALEKLEVGCGERNDCWP